MLASVGCGRARLDPAAGCCSRLSVESFQHALHPAQPAQPPGTPAPDRSFLRGLPCSARTMPGPLVSMVPVRTVQQRSRLRAQGRQRLSRPGPKLWAQDTTCNVCSCAGDSCRGSASAPPLCVLPLPLPPLPRQPEVSGASCAPVPSGTSSLLDFPALPLESLS